MRCSLAIPALVLVTACAGKAPPPSSTVQRPRPPPSQTSAASAPAEAPPYDLATDQQRRMRTAKEELGARTVTAIISDVFVVIGAPGWGGADFDKSLSLFRNAMAGYMNGRFKKKPEQAVSVYLFPTKAAYVSFCKNKWDAPCVGQYGTYHPTERYLMMNIGAGFGGLTHEIVHP